MIDFYYHLRQQMVETMQRSLRQIRQVLEFGVQEFGDLIGLTRQTINNLETQKNKMSSTQYVAICAVIDNCVKDKLELLPILSTILRSNEREPETSIFETIENGSLLKKWFLAFPDESKIINRAQGSAPGIINGDFNNVADSYRVFLDQTAIFEEGFSTAIQPLASVMKESGNKFIVPLKVIEAIQHQAMSCDGDAVKIAKDGMNLLMTMQNSDLIEIRGEKSDVNIVSTFVSVFAKFKCVNRLALITCNPSLAHEINMLNNGNLGGFNILILTYSRNSGIHQWDEDVNKDLTIVEPIVEENNYISNMTEGDIPRGWETID